MNLVVGPELGLEIDHLPSDTAHSVCLRMECIQVETFGDRSNETN